MHYACVTCWRKRQITLAFDSRGISCKINSAFIALSESFRHLCVCLPLMEVFRPDFMGLGLVSVSYLIGFGLEVQRSCPRLLYGDHKTNKKEKMKIEAWKKKNSSRKTACFGSRSRSRILKVSGLARGTGGLGLEWSGLGFGWWGLGLGWWGRDSITAWCLLYLVEFCTL